MDKVITKFEFNKDVSLLTISNCRNDCCEKLFDLKNPTLMTDIPKSLIACRNKNNHIALVLSVYNYSKIRKILYDQVEIDFDQSKYPNVFGPNIDTILFCYSLQKLSAFPFHSCLEIGIGSGFISKYIIEKQKNTCSTLIDINPNSVEYNLTHFPNHHLQETNKHSCFNKVYTSYDDKITLIHGDALILIDLLKTKKIPKYDLIVCNPPYIPIELEEDVDRELDFNLLPKNFFQGTYLMRYILKNFENITNNCLLMCFSSTSFCVPFVQLELDRLTIHNNLEILVERRIPLKVFDTDKKYWIQDDENIKSFLTSHFQNKNELGFETGCRTIDDILTHVVYVVKIQKK